tara:strand:- start:46 stop:231 length:186 start_codon:yes stop_codon:yes gene_type:complete
VQPLASLWARTHTSEQERAAQPGQVYLDGSAHELHVRCGPPMAGSSSSLLLDVDIVINLVA